AALGRRARFPPGHAPRQSVRKAPTRWRRGKEMLRSYFLKNHRLADFGFKDEGGRMKKDSGSFPPLAFLLAGKGGRSPCFFHPLSFRLHPFKQSGDLRIAQPFG